MYSAFADLSVRRRLPLDVAVYMMSVLNGITGCLALSRR